jgi:hypothetical protein
VSLVTAFLAGEPGLGAALGAPFRLFFIDTTGELTLQDLTVRDGQT